MVYVREFCENRAFVRAVVSLPPETFVSSGASVKASLLFLQKFTEEDRAKFQATQDQAKLEVEARHTPTLESETERLQIAIAEAEKAGNSAERTARKKELALIQKATEEQIKKESRALLKERFEYPVFLYEADKVGITATGEKDENELFPNDNKPSWCVMTCLELYEGFKRNPASLLAGGSTR